MKNNKLMQVVIILSVFFFQSFIIGCNSDDGDGGSNDEASSYNGATGQVRISEDNTQPIAEMTLAALFGETSQLSFISGAIAENANNISLSIQLETSPITNILKRYNKLNANEVLTSAASGYTEEGECGGSLTITGDDGSNQAGNVSIDGQMSFNNYCECSWGDCDTQLISNGALTGVGNGVSVYDDDIEEYYLQSGQVIYSFDNINLKIIENESLQANITMTGKIENSWVDSEDSSEQNMKMNTVRIDNLTNKTIWMDNLTIISTEDWYEGEATISVNGKVYYQDYGYVDITTVDIVLIDAWHSVHPYDGVLVISGSNGSKMRITFMYDSYSVESDLNGDGIYEYDLLNQEW